MAVEFWRMGPAPVPGTETAEFARGFEADGWDGFTVGEALGLKRPPYAVLASAAVGTKTLGLGTADVLTLMVVRGWALRGTALLRFWKPPMTEQGLEQFSSANGKSERFYILSKGYNVGQYS